MPTLEDTAKIQVGSRVAICSRYNVDLAVVDRETATQLIVGQKRYRKTDGYRVGEASSGCGRDYIRLATHADVDMKIRAKLIAHLNAVTHKELKDIDTASIEEACELLGLLGAADHGGER